MCIVQKGIKAFRALSPASILVGNLMSFKPTIPYAPYTHRCVQSWNDNVNNEH